MSELTCPVQTCQETALHEHRTCQYSITGDHHWYDLRESDVRLLNEARAAKGQPILLFGTVQSEAEQLIWGPETGLQPAPEAPANEV